MMESSRYGVMPHEHDMQHRQLPYWNFSEASAYNGTDSPISPSLESRTKVGLSPTSIAPGPSPTNKLQLNGHYASEKNGKAESSFDLGWSLAASAPKPRIDRWNGVTLEHSAASLNPWSNGGEGILHGQYDQAVQNFTRGGRMAATGKQTSALAASHGAHREDNDRDAIGRLLPDDEEELFSGLADNFERTVNIGGRNVEDQEDFDLFSSGGGMELGEVESDYAYGFRSSDSFAGLHQLSSSAPTTTAIAGEHPSGEHPSRTLFVRNINSNVEDSELRALFEQYGDIRQLYTACKHRGFVMISYYDIRSARSAMRALQNKPLRRRKLDIHFSIPKENPSDKDINQGTLVVFNLDPSVTTDELRQIFSQHGEVKEIRETPHKRHHKFIEFYDVRAAESALRALNRSDIAGKRIKLEPSRPGGARRSSMTTSHSADLLDEELLYKRSNSPHRHSPPAHLGAPWSLQEPQHHSFSSSVPNRTLQHALSTPPNYSPFLRAAISNSGASSQGLPPFPSSPIRMPSQELPGPSYLGPIGSRRLPPQHPHSLPSYDGVYYEGGNEYEGGVAISDSARLRVDEAKEQSYAGVVEGLSYQSSGLAYHSSHHAGATSIPGAAAWTHQGSPQPQGPQSPSRFGWSSLSGSAPSLTLPQRIGRLGLERQSSAQSLIPPSPIPLQSRLQHTSPSGHYNFLAGESPDGRGSSSVKSLVDLDMGPSSPVMDITRPGSPYGRDGVVVQPMGKSSSANDVRRAGKPESAASPSQQPGDSKKQYQLDLDRIMAGEDKRTTLMIKNIPNKYTQKMLLAAIDEQHKGTYDFFYLPIDFKNKCNVGYAFINLVTPIKIVDFYHHFNGKKWEKFNSEKVASLAYARIQGKIALVAHFQNSSLMNEDKRCRPILFHSEGPHVGDQEPFPVGSTRIRPSRSSSGLSIGSPKAGDSNSTGSPCDEDSDLRLGSTGSLLEMM